jgi:hypothetical protein
MVITSAIYGHYFGQTSAADSNRCNTQACHHVAEKVPGLHCHSSNKWRYTSDVALENHHYGYHHTHQWTAPCVQLGTTDNE